jgi:hypothetical protein
MPSLTRPLSARVALLLAALAAASCARPEQSADLRGAGHPVARLSPADRAAAYDVALRQVFDVDSALTLLVDPAALPRDGGYERAHPIPGPVLLALRSNGAVRGTCEPARSEPGHAPSCRAGRAGYVVRLSDIFQLPGDTVRLFVAVERYRTPDAGSVKRFAFEDGYELSRAARGWSVEKRARRVIQ